MTATQSLLAVLLTPLVSAALITFFFRRMGKVASAISVLAAAGIFVFSLLAIRGAAGEAVAASWDWLTFGDYSVSMGFLFDGVAATMLTMVGAVGFLIHLFSLGYMADDKGRARFFGGLSIFMFSMLGIVLADNLIMIFVFWSWSVSALIC